MVYVDHSQWNDTTLIIAEDPPEGQDSPDIVIDTTFTYTRTVLGPDSLMFRINSDCNNDGQWTEAEQFDDTGLDGCFDENESGYMYLLDADGNLVSAPTSRLRISKPIGDRPDKTTFLSLRSKPIISAITNAILQSSVNRLKSIST